MKLFWAAAAISTTSTWKLSPQGIGRNYRGLGSVHGIRTSSIAAGPMKIITFFILARRSSIVYHLVRQFLASESSSSQNLLCRRN
jgi:hypothetical protein